EEREPRQEEPWQVGDQVLVALFVYASLVLSHRISLMGVSFLSPRLVAAVVVSRPLDPLAWPAPLPRRRRSRRRRAQQLPPCHRPLLLRRSARLGTLCGRDNPTPARRRGWLRRPPSTNALPLQGHLPGSGPARRSRRDRQRSRTRAPGVRASSTTQPCRHLARGQAPSPSKGWPAEARLIPGVSARPIRTRQRKRRWRQRLPGKRLKQLPGHLPRRLPSRCSRARPPRHPSAPAS